INSAMANPSAHEEIFVAKAIGDIRLIRISGDGEEFVAEFGREDFVGVGVIDPGMFEGDVFERPILMSGPVVEFSLDDARAGGFGDGERLIGAEGVENDDVVAPFYRFEASGKIFLLV